MENCDKPVRCYDYMTRKCIREKGHTGGCNPFSNTAPLDQQVQEKKNDKTAGQGSRDVGKT